MSKKYILVLIFLFLAFLLIAQLIKPNSNELIYVYEKTKNYGELKEQYEKKIEKKNDDLKTQEKYKDTLEKLNDSEFISYSENFYDKTKDRKTARKIIEYYKNALDFDNSLVWLEKLYEDTKDEKILNEIIELSSYSKKIEKQKKYLLEKYSNTKDRKVLYDLYDIGEKEFSLNELFNLAYLKKFDKDEVVKIFKLLIYSKKFDNAKILYNNYDLITYKLIENKDLYIYLNETFRNTEELKKIYLKLYEKTKEKKYFANLEYFYIDEGNIKSFLQMHKVKYNKTKSQESLDLLIKYSYYNENKLDYLHYLGIKGLKQKNTEIIKSVISNYIDLEKTDLLKEYIDKAAKLTDKFDESKEIVVNTYIYLKESYKAQELIYSFKPKEIDPSIILKVFKDNINESNLEYFMYALPRLNNDKLTAKLFKYRYTTSRLFTEETYKYFNRPTTFNKLYSYIGKFPKEDIKKVLLKFSKNSDDPQFLAQIAEYFWGENEYNLTKEIAQKALEIYPDNKLALKNSALVYLAQKDNNNALKYLSKLYDLNYKDIYVNYQLALLYTQMEDFKKATKHYKIIVDNSENESIEDKRIYLLSKAKIYSIDKIVEDFEELITKSNYNEYYISDFIYLFFNDKQYDKVLEYMDKYINITEDSLALQKLKIQTYIAKNDITNAKNLIRKIEERYPKDEDLWVYYQDIANSLSNQNNKNEALPYYEKAFLLSKNNQNLEETINEIRKDTSSNISLKVGVRSKINENHIQATYVNKTIKLKVRNDHFDKYNSAKIEASDVNEKYLIGIGKDYYNLQLNNIKNTGITLHAKKSVDSNSKSTINDELIYKNLGFKYSTNINNKFYITSEINHYNYSVANFKRTRIENSFYYPFFDKYFANLSYVYEKVKNANNYGYKDISSPIISLGANDKYNKKYSYYYALGAEYRDSTINPFANLNLYYKNSHLKGSLENSISKDYLADEYNYTSMINLSYYFIK